MKLENAFKTIFARTGWMDGGLFFNEKTLCIRRKIQIISILFPEFRYVIE